MTPLIREEVMFQDHLGMEVPQLPNSNFNQKLYFNNEYQDLLNEKIKKQYIDMLNLGNNLLEDENVENDIYIELLEFTNNNYVSLAYLEYIMNHPQKINILGYSCYRLLCVDLLNSIIPRILNEQRIPQSRELLVTDTSILRNLIMKSIVSKLDNLRKIKYDIMSPKMKTELTINMLFLDIIDNDTETLIYQFIHPLIYRYEMLLDAKIL